MDEFPNTWMKTTGISQIYDKIAITSQVAIANLS